MRTRLLLAFLLLVSAILPSVGAPTVLAAPATQAAPDPGTTGPFAVSRAIYDGGDLYYVPPSWGRAVEFRGRVVYPTNLAAGPFPLIVLLHGRHFPCLAPNLDFIFTWPCPAGYSVVPSYLGYDYLADQLASHGFIVVSVSANGINGWDRDHADDGMVARGDAIIRHLQLWATFNAASNGTFGNLFVGRVNLNFVGLMGHSRGGEGVVRAAQINAAAGSPFGIRAVFLLAPTNFSRPVINNVPLAVMLSYCDGDLADFQGVHYYDDTRYNVANDSGAKYTILAIGANHNFYNTAWTPGGYAGASDDWFIIDNTPPTGADAFCSPNIPGNGRLSAAQQRGTGTAYMAAFFRVYLRGENSFAPILQGDAAPPASAQTTAIKVSYHAPGTAAARRDINRYLSSGNVSLNTIGGAVTAIGFGGNVVCGGDAPQPRFCLPSSTTTSFSREPHSGVSLRVPNQRGAGVVSLQWGTPLAVYKNDISAGLRDVRAFTRLQFRVGLDWSSGLNTSGVPQNFGVVLTDGAGRQAAAAAANFSSALDFPPGNLPAVTPKAMLNMVSIPMSAFSGLDLSDVRTVEFHFNAKPTGALLFTDIAFANAVPAAPPTVSGATPTGVLRGTPVTVTGTNLTGATSVKFNGAEANAVTVLSSTQIFAIVPINATSGPISVTTPGGTASSPTNFIVYQTPGNAGVQVGNLPGTSLAASLSARVPCGNISTIQFGTAGTSFKNAVVTVVSPAGGPSTQSFGFTYTPPAGTTSVTVVITRAVESGSATVNPIVINDGCGAWNTFVGGGPDAFR